MNALKMMVPGKFRLASSKNSLRATLWIS
jgi:hypothetical protein